jgi:hypothetical protein
MVVLDSKTRASGCRGLRGQHADRLVIIYSDINDGGVRLGRSRFNKLKGRGSLEKGRRNPLLLIDC